jgi:hypothetical protein
MTPQEFEYIQRAVKALESSDITEMTQAKILRTVSQICGKNATLIEQKLVDKVDGLLYNTNSEQRSDYA